MPQVSRQALLPYKPDEMYYLVNDVKNYHLFVPQCAGATILSESVENVVVRLDLSVGPMISSFTTRNQLVPNKHVTMSLDNGPFRYLDGVWSFIPLGDLGCKVLLELDFEFSNPIFSLTLNAMLKRLTEQMFEAFIKRADEVYGDVD